MKLISPLLRTIRHKNYYDLFSCWGGHIPAPKSLFRFAPVWIRGKDRDWGFFKCPKCGKPSFFQGECNATEWGCWKDPCYDCDNGSPFVRSEKICEACVAQEIKERKRIERIKAAKKWVGILGVYHKGVKDEVYC